MDRLRDGLREAYRSDGCTDACPVLGEQDLHPIQGLIWDLTAHMLPRNARDRPIGERLRLPFAKAPATEDVARLMNTVQQSSELQALTELPAVVECFSRVLGTNEIELFPISRFRAQMPGLARSSFAWHQDEGTWYAVAVKDLADRLPATLWLSLNGADASNSIELIPGSHRFGLAHHRYQDGQGYFRGVVPRRVAKLERRCAAARPGDGILVHPLLFHRSISAASGAPRYSVDVRYCLRARTRPTHRVDPRLRVRRWLTW